MTGPRLASPLRHAIERLGPGHRDADADAQVRHAVARCVGRGQSAPLGAQDITALAGTLSTRHLRAGDVLFPGDGQPAGVWIVRHGQVELAVGSGRRRVVVGVLRPGDVDGDIEFLLDMPLPYTGRALEDVTCLHLSGSQFDQLLTARAAIARRWVSSVAQRLAASQNRIIGLLGKSLTEQAAGLLCDEAVDGQVQLPQRTLAAMLGVQRPSLNKILKELERAGHITIRYAAIDIRDHHALAALAGRSGPSMG